MKQSLTYYITLFVIHLKGLKKEFSNDPIDFKKIRKNDVHHPKGTFFKQNIKRSFKISDSLITEVGLSNNINKLVLFIHGGAFISGPAQHHWDAVKKIAKQTNYRIWMCDYPKAPENKIVDISRNIDTIYKIALEHYQSNQIFIVADSAGGTLATSLIQRLIKKNIELPKKIILISPVMDGSMSNPEIEKIDAIDPMISKKGVLSAKQMCVGNNDLKDSMISPLYGSFEKFPHTIIFSAKHDITYPDQKLAVQKCIDSKINLKLIEGQNMPHIWPLLPIMKEAKTALNKNIETLKN